MDTKHVKETETFCPRIIDKKQGDTTKVKENNNRSVLHIEGRRSGGRSRKRRMVCVREDRIESRKFM